MYIGIDIGATKVRVAIGDLHHGIVKKIEEETRRESSEIFINQIIEMIQKLTSNDLSNITSIGIGSIGPIDYKKGVILNPPNVFFKNVPIVKELEEKFQKPVYLLNDCTVAVLGEKFFGLGREVKNVFYVTLSTGIGGGAIVDGNLLIGKDGNAVEIGHMVVDLKGRLLCGCGGAGHWEAYCSGRNIPRFTEYLLEDRPEEFYCENLEKLIREEKLTSEKLFELAKSGDMYAFRVVEEIGRINAIGFANINTLYDPELITVGGAIALKNQDLILDPVKKQISRYTPNNVAFITITPLREDIVLYGAISLASNPIKSLRE
ncbi:MAG: ROK family protein [Aigarchaeota archaeon]|nr:ROK family protein [Aigarchaeota archaeon]MCX8193339.1 ROK family protein [Nitrososphaeria archaeon]MDW7985869.1 ROK family protein [Nitrososphaerota archaeon]